MSYFEDASLVMIPSGYKTSKVYSVKPTDGSGDLTFTRSNDTATRVASNGLIEKVRTNLLTYSNDFSNAAWNKIGGTTLTAGQADYLGGTNAWKWESNSIAIIQLGQNVTTSAATANHSIYAKAGSVTSFSIWIGSAVTFDLSTGTITAGSGTITSVGNGWYRCSVNRTTVSSTNTLNPYFVAASAGDYIFISFAQTELSDIATDYIATTSAAVSVGPVANVPRLDYLNSSCPRLLLEPQRTNLALWSEQLNNAEYTADNAAFTANATTSPDSYTNADLLTENTSAASHGFYASVVPRGTTGASLTMSIFAKSNGRRYINISGGFDSGNYYHAVYDLQTGVVSTTGNVGAGTVPTASIVSYGNGWYRCILTGSVTGLPNRLSFVYLTDATTGNGVAGRSYTGNGTSGVYFYGYQMEAGAYATSYIPTLGAAVTRGADAASKTGISSLIGQTEGTLFCEVNLTAGLSDDIYFIGNTTNGVALTLTSANRIKVYIRQNGVQSTIQSGVLTSFENIKLAIGYKTGDIALYVNGSSAATATTALSFSAAINDLFLATNATWEGNNTTDFKQALLFTSRLSNADLAALTA